MKTIIKALLATSLLISPALAETNAPSLKGVWKTAKQDDENRTAHVEIANCADNPAKLCGKIIALEEPLDPETSLPKRDKENPDKSLRNRAVMGLYMLLDFSKTDESTYENGTIYSPRTGKTYNSKIHLNKDGILEVTGYVFIFSKTQEWTRVSMVK